MKTNKLASEIVGGELLSALRHSPGFMVGSLHELKKQMRRDGTLNVKAYVEAFLRSAKLDDDCARKYPNWRRAA